MTDKKKNEELSAEDLDKVTGGFDGKGNDQILSSGHSTGVRKADDKNFSFGVERDGNGTSKDGSKIGAGGGGNDI